MCRLKSLIGWILALSLACFNISFEILSIPGLFLLFSCISWLAAVVISVMVIGQHIPVCLFSQLWQTLATAFPCASSTGLSSRLPLVLREAALVSAGLDQMKRLPLSLSVVWYVRGVQFHF